MRDSVPHLFEHTPDLLYQLVTMVSPRELRVRLRDAPHPLCSVGFAMDLKLVSHQLGRVVGSGCYHELGVSNASANFWLCCA